MKKNFNILMSSTKLIIIILFFIIASSRIIYSMNKEVKMDIIGRYDVDSISSTGGLEIVIYNKMNKTAYAVDGKNSLLIAIPLETLNSKKYTDLNDKGIEIDISSITKSNVKDFIYGDITSVAISEDNTKLAVSIQEKTYNKSGIVAVFPIDDSKDTLGKPEFYTVGFQPDMVIFSGNKTILSADEGEPRLGYGVNSQNEKVEDPKGSISIINLNKKIVNTVYFDEYDTKKEELINSGILLTKGQDPSVDLEPEYITLNNDNTKAYISLQENNAVAILDLNSEVIEGVYPLGFKDFSVKGNEIYLDGTAKTYKDLVGAFMPDGICTYEKDKVTYIITSNEGDAREWSSSVYPDGHEDEGDLNKEDSSYYNNEKKITIKDGENELKKVVVIDKENTLGLNQDKETMFGSRSFSIFKVTDRGLENVYDSKSDFEDITQKLYINWFNASHDNLELNDRSKKKGPEPENVTVGTIDNKTFAFIALERIGGVMVYDITEPSSAFYVNYFNTRDFTAKDGIGGDSGPEGLSFISAKDSPTKKPLLLVGCEITGTMPIYEIN